MMEKGQIIELKIEKLVYGGEGLGRYDNKAIFVADTAPGDTVKAEIVSSKKSYAKAMLKEIVEPSEHRVKPFCPLFKACGGCQWQFVSYDEQLRSKKIIVEEAMRKLGDVPVKDTISSTETKEFRCKVQFPVQQTKVSKRFLAGYYAKGSHDLVNIKYCPVQPAIIDEITEFLRKKAQDLELTSYNEKFKQGLIRHFVFRYSKTNKNLILTIVINRQEEPEKLVELCNAVKQSFDDLEGVIVNFNTTRSNLILAQESKLIVGKDFVEEELGGKFFKVSHDSFFQVNPQTAIKMFEEVREIVKERADKSKILDIYAGSGSFSIFLSDIASDLTLVESSKKAIEDAGVNLAKNNVENFSFINENADVAIPKLAEDKAEFDVIVLDPPRKGCSKEVLEGLKHLKAKYLVYISCNPATLARDMELLKDSFEAEFVQPVDMFCHTYHVESILVAKAI